MKKLQTKFKLLSFLLVAGLLFSSVTIPVKAFIQKQGTVNEAVILRQNPDSTSNQVMELSNGQAVKVNNEITGSDGATWYQITINNGSTFGYVPVNTITISSGSSNTEEPTGSGTTVTMQTVTITEKIGTVTATSAVRVRAQATTSSDQVASMQPNATFLVLSEVSPGDGYVWYELEYDDNGTQVHGYVRSDLVKVEETTREEQVPVEIPSTDVPSEPVEVNAPYSITSQVNAEGTTVWYLMDNNTGEAKEVTSLLTPQTTKSGGGVYKVIVVILLILLILAAAAATFFYMRWQDAEEFILELREKQARTRKQPVPVTQPAPAKQQVTKQAPVAPKPASTPTSKPVTQPASQPANKPAVQPASQPANKPVTQSAAQPTNKPVTQSAAQPTNKPVTQSAAQPINKPVSQPASQPINKPAAQPASQPVEKPEVQDVLPKTSDIVKATKQELQNNQTNAVKNAQSSGWKSKNFLTDDDDLEFDFLDMDDK
ncbi:MAG: SH3 domain-containing protein [Lachnospiraceae bacterium]|nr:SH3 domain-containing protein [Lachnospiraceae bacterium]